MEEAIIRSGSKINVTSLTNKGESVTIELFDVSTRIWSSVAKGKITAPIHQAGRSVFVKQYIDRSGKPHPQVRASERLGAEVATEILSDIVTIPQIIFENCERYISVFEYVDLLSMDELLRADPVAFDQAMPKTLLALKSVMQAFETRSADVQSKGIKSKPRSFGDTSSVTYKSLDVRNVGIVKNDSNTFEVAMFDFSQPYFGPIEEAGAKLILTIGSLNWGRPISRFVKGPDKALLTEATHILAPWMNARAVAEELDYQEEFRLNNFMGESAKEVFLKRFGVSLIGKRYFKEFRKWFEDSFDMSTL